MRFHRVLFDLDGTLVDSLPLIIECSRLAGEEIGLPWNEERIRGMIGIPLLETGERLLGKGKGVYYRDVYLKYFHLLHNEKIAVFAGIPEMLDDLRKEGIQMAVVTSKIYDSAMLTLRETGLFCYFDQIITASEPCTPKPSPAPALLCLERMGRGKEGAVFVGDSPYDMQCGKGAELSTCGVCWGMAKREILAAEHPDYLVDTVNELTALLLTGREIEKK